MKNRTTVFAALSKKVTIENNLTFCYKKGENGKMLLELLYITLIVTKALQCFIGGRPIWQKKNKMCFMYERKMHSVPPSEKHYPFNN